MSAYSASRRRRGRDLFAGHIALRIGFAGSVFTVGSLAGCSGATSSPLFEDGGAPVATPPNPATPLADASAATPVPFTCGVETCQANEYCRSGAESMCRFIPFGCPLPATCACVEAKAGGGPGQGCNNATCTDTNGQILLTCQ
jgi:hypothetical protein